jgi:hypothetical protein
MSHEIASETRITYFDGVLEAGSTKYMNLVKDLSWMNSRNHQHTDNEGHVIGYWADIQIIAPTTAQFSFSTAPNTWKMRNAFRKFHFARDHMFRNAGVTRDEMGKYGRTIRPFMDQGQVSYADPAAPVEANTMVPLGCTDSEREWTYTSLGATPGFGDTAMDAVTLDVVDQYLLTICDDNNVEATDNGIEQYSTAGMIHSYNLDRMEVVTPDAEEVISGPNNPLALLRTQSVTGGLVVDIAEDQELEAPPYDIRDNGDSTNEIVVDYARTNADTLSKVTLRNVFIPAGIIAMRFDPDDSATHRVYALVDVKGWSYCKDLA